MEPPTKFGWRPLTCLETLNLISCKQHWILFTHPSIRDRRSAQTELTRHLTLIANQSVDTNDLAKLQFHGLIVLNFALRWCYHFTIISLYGLFTGSGDPRILWLLWNLDRKATFPFVLPKFQASTRGSISWGSGMKWSRKSMKHVRASCTWIWLLPDPFYSWSESWLSSPGFSWLLWLRGGTFPQNPLSSLRNFPYRPCQSLPLQRKTLV